MSWFKKRAEMPEPAASDEWSQKHGYGPMEVVRTDDGSIVPAYESSWDDATKLQWEAGVLKADTGFSVTFYQPATGRRDKVDWLTFGVVAPEGAGAFVGIRVNDFTYFAVGARWGIEWAKKQVADNVE